MKITNKLKIALKSLLELSLSEIATDKAVLIYDGELAEGIEVFVKDESEEMQVPENGDYATEDKVITIEDGKIVKIVEKEVQETEEKLSFNESKVKMSASYNEIYRNIQAAVDNLGVEGYVISAGEDFAVISVWEDNKEVFYRYGVITNEDGSIVLGEKEEVKPAYVPVNTEMAEDEQPKPADEPEDEEKEDTETRLASLETKVTELISGIEKFLNSVASIEGRVNEIETKIAQLESTPDDKPIEEKPQEEVKESKLSFLRK